MVLISLIIIVVIFISVYSFYSLMGFGYVCEPSAAPSYYCKNTTDNLIESNLGQCDENYQVGVVSHLLCPKPFEEEYKYYIGENLVSENYFFDYIDEVNSSCNGCIVMVHAVVL